MLFLNKYGPNAYDSNLYTLVKFADEVERLRAIEQRAKELADEPYSKIGPAAGYAEWILRGNED